MGHSRIGVLPATRKWKEVVELLASGAGVAEVADATVRATERAFAWVQDDPGFSESIQLLTTLGIAGSQPDPIAYMKDKGVTLTGANSPIAVAMAVAESLDQRIDASRQRSDFGEMAAKAMVSVMTRYMSEQLHGLFAPTGDAVTAALKTLGKPRVFGELAKDYVATLSNATMSYFLSKTMATHLGAEQRFATANQMANFEAGLKKQGEEMSVIVKEFASSWFSKQRHEQGGTISRESAEGFGWYAMQKMRAELGARAKNNG